VVPEHRRSSRAQQAEQTRRLILEVARKLFAHVGYEATSTQMIAEELGLTKAAVHYHFPAKADILLALAEPGKQRLTELLDEAESMRGRRARVEHLTAGYAEYLVRNRHHGPAFVAGTTVTDDAASLIHRRGLAVLFGDRPSAAERLAYQLIFALPANLPSMSDLPDEELRQILSATMLRLLRV
jgi:AcrR family transcriptional regulator